MVMFISYLIAVVLTAALAVILYPIAGIFWLMGQVGKIGNVMFAWTNRLIKKLWADLSSNTPPTPNP